MLKKIIILILVLIVLLGFPVLINVLFTIKSPFNFLVAEFSAGDLLAYGALVGSIFYGFMMFKKEHRNNVKPFFTVKLLTVENNYNMAYDLINTNINRKDPSDETPLYKEFIASEFYVILDESGINYQNRLSNYDQEIIKKKGLELKRNGETRSAILNDYIS
ncbi:MAG: hypothetical protein Q8N92_03550, partial [Erysipelotrichaceae bacterium]|nr:hypothetical protein [Erysipelotrichaceae bacterium]